MLLDGLTLQFKDVLSSRQIIVFMKLLPSMIGLYNSIYSSYFFNKWSRVLVPGTFAFILSYGLTNYLGWPKSKKDEFEPERLVLNTLFTGMMVMLSINI